ncbi:MAG: sugar ABC transporter permease [Anaerolineae bacterium]|nr:sugar ABC transporter permease [Anaerolineae bacterium]NUQ06129.1 sugar ABC transporter permease [Anaerolineae bacterium]
MENIKTRSDDQFSLTELGLAALAVLATFAFLYGGFVFLRDSGISQILTALLAVVWGVGGVAVLYYVGNLFIEKLPHNWTVRLQPFLFVGPAVALLAWYLAVPTVRTFALSLYNANSTEFVGLKNYQAVFTERIMLEALSNNLLWMIVGTTLTVGFGLLIAILADRSSFEKTAKSLIFLPMAISMVGAGVIWKFIFDFNPNIGLVNAAVVGLGGEQQAWLSLVQPWNNLFLIIVMVWLQTGYAMVLISAAIKGIPDELLEAARVDGAGEILIFLRIIVPNIAGTLLTVITTIVIFTLKIFDVVMVMTGGQFGTEVIGVRFYREMWTNGNAGYGSAIAIVLLIAVVPVMIYNLREFSKRRAF